MSGNNFYSDAKFGVIQRHWFGLTKKVGGDSAAGFTLNAEAATKTIHVTRFYPKGPIKVLKAGHLVLATIACTATTFDRLPLQYRKAGVTQGVWYLADAAAQYTIGSVTSFTEATVPAGGYVGIVSGTAQTGDATEVTTATVSGTLSFFIDYVPTFDVSGKWDT